MFLSGKNLRSEPFKTGQGTKPKAGEASWPRPAFRKSFPPLIQTPLKSKSKPDTMPFSNSPPQCGLHWSYYSPSVSWVTNRKPPSDISWMWHNFCHLSKLDWLFVNAVRELFIFPYSWRISFTICLLIMASVSFALAGYFTQFQDNVWLHWQYILQYCENTV